ncbi:kinase-like domain-containing protein, partial [Mycena leptocephala]
MSIVNVTLSSPHPVKTGGFASIYRGTYVNRKGKTIDIALKLLKIFETQSEDDRLRLSKAFCKEALVWQYLRHKNIVSLLGIDSTTFLARAMVSRWMRHGNVLDHMKEKPFSKIGPGGYAIQLLLDVLAGLEYLHSVDIIHGDLCGRNILIGKQGQACLTDFGLAAFVDSGTSVKTSNHAGSTRWMAAELLAGSDVPFKRTRESDIWALACVCCEIWTEGQAPFPYIKADGAVVMAINVPQNGNPWVTQPCDKQGNAMPELLWEVVQRCWERTPSERPSLELLRDVLTEQVNQFHTGPSSQAGPSESR